jgi:IPT/TIG domain
MRISLLVVALLLLVAVPAHCQSIVPLMKQVQPESGMIGDVFVAQGDNLGQANVANLYLTDGKNDTKVLIAEQTATSIKFTLPPGTKTGRFMLMVLTTGKNPRLIEEPVRITVEPGAKPAT